MGVCFKFPGWVTRGMRSARFFCNLEVGFMEIILMVVLLAITLAFGWAATKLGMAKVVGQLIAGVVVAGIATLG